MMKGSLKISEISQPGKTKKQSWAHLPEVVLHWLTELGAGLPEPGRRRARMLAWLLLTLIFLVSVTLMMVFIVDSSQVDRRNLYAALIAGLLFLLVIAFGLNHTGRYKASVLLTVTCMVAGPWGAIALDRSILKGDFVPLVYIALSVTVYCSRHA
jgi:threonine/homoserine efflux transporter RhtA